MSLALNDFKCGQCGNVEERLEAFDTTIGICSKCGGNAKKIITVSGVFTANEDARWIKSVREVVEKNSGKPHCEEFLKDPTRKNYKQWMKKEGLRPLEVGEKAEKIDEAVIHNTITKEVYKKHRQRHALEIRT